MEPPADDVATPTIFNIEPDVKVDIRSLPRLVRIGTQMVWTAGRSEFLTSTVLQLGGGLGLVLQLLLGRRALDALLAASPGGSVSSILPWALAVAAVTAILFFASSVQRERQQILGELVSRHVEGRILDVASAVELEAFEDPAFHNRLQRIRMSSFQPLNLVYGLSGLAGSAIGVVSVVLALAFIEPLLIPLIAVVLFPAWLVGSRRGKAFYSFFWRMTPRDRERHYLGAILSDRDAAKEVRGFGSAAYLRGRYDLLYDERLAELRSVARRHLAYALVANTGIGLMLGLTLLLVGWMALRGSVPLPEAGMAIAGVAVVGARLTQAGYAAGSLAEAALYMDDYRWVLEHRFQRSETKATTAPAPKSFRRIEVDHVMFTYPTGERAALQDVSLHIDAGEIVALVGENGSGKTTLAKLLARLYTPDTGTIHWDGVDMTTFEPEELRRSVAVIFQDFVRYSLAARDNIGLGRVEAIHDLEAIRAASLQSGADPFLRGLSSGYETQLGPQFEGGTDLSTGQWQRVALARAFFRDAPFVILDEPTAALDPRGEHDLFERIRTLLANRTVLLISHRFSSVRSADRIYVLDEGRVIEDGSHEELVARGGVYAELFTLQAKAYVEAESSSER